MSDFLQRESDILGDEFGTPTGGTYATAGGEIDFDRAASAFPEISLDGDISIPPAAAAPPLSASESFSFDDFSTPPSRTTEVKVTGDDEIEKFESEFPDIEVPQVRPVYGYLSRLLLKSGTYAYNSKLSHPRGSSPCLARLPPSHPSPRTHQPPS